MERLVLFAKTPRLHAVKTRLTPRLTPEQALELHEAMLEDQLAFARSFQRSGRTAEVCLDLPAPLGGRWAELTAGLALTDQGEGDLGARMRRALARTFADRAARTAILGADAPTLPMSLVEEAFAALRAGAEAAIVPAEDGGYVLIGASREVGALFEGIPWGTPQVARATRDAARSKGYTLAETAPWADVDGEGDLPRLALELAEAPGRAPATAKALARLGLYAARNPMV